MSFFSHRSLTLNFAPEESAFSPHPHPGPVEPGGNVNEGEMQSDNSTLAPGTQKALLYQMIGLTQPQRNSHYSVLTVMLSWEKFKSTAPPDVLNFRQTRNLGIYEKFVSF